MEIPSYKCHCSNYFLAFALFVFLGASSTSSSFGGCFPSLSARTTGRNLAGILLSSPE
jgi:hypothetical protein